MAFDGIVTKVITSELQNLSGARIDKIFQQKKNTILLGILVNNLEINKFIAKLFIELLLFILSYIIQKIFVFKSL